MSELIYLDGIPHRKLGPKEDFHNGDRFIDHATIGARWQTVHGYPITGNSSAVAHWSQYSFYREIEPLIAAMLEAKHENESH